MITLFVTTSSASCRKARQWLEQNGIPYKERNMLVRPLSMEEFKRILERTEIGTEEIISVRSKVFQELGLEIESLSLRELHKIIEQYPTIMRRPILIDDKRLQVGFNEEEIRRFLPRSTRTSELMKFLTSINE